MLPIPQGSTSAFEVSHSWDTASVVLIPSQGRLLYAEVKQRKCGSQKKATAFITYPILLLTVVVLEYSNTVLYKSMSGLT
jgi:hypothetical protein